jgi:hypothetical protein
MSSTGQEYYRSDGVRIQHNPYTPEMIEKVRVVVKGVSGMVWWVREVVW